MLSRIMNEMLRVRREGGVAMETTTRGARLRKPWWREALEWLMLVAAALLIASGVHAAIAEPVRVEGGSMLDTLADGEIMLVTKFDYLLGDPKRFDVVICNYPNRKEYFVKRIVGMPGDRVRVTGGVLYVNGQAYPENYLTRRPNYELPETEIPEGQYFVLGDNRPNSNDSHLIGTLTRAQIRGHVRRVLYPFSAWRAVE